MMRISKTDVTAKLKMQLRIIKDNINNIKKTDYKESQKNSSDVLEKLDNGEITPEEALELLK